MKALNMTKTVTMVAALVLLSACASVPKMPSLLSSELSDIPQGDIALTGGPYQNALMQPVAFKSQGAPYSEQTSLWSNSPNSLFGDRRASQTGDILTVMIEIDEEAEMQKSSSSNSASDNNMDVNALFGLPEIINNILPAGASLNPGIDVSRSRNSNGDSSIRRGEKITLSLALQVTNVLPNGYMSIAGRQDIMVNDEIRNLQVAGLVRPEDISRQNVITYDKIANAKIYYGGSSYMSWRVQGTAKSKLLNSLNPF